jgi:DNA-binding beta-propeller fold protein YncE
MVQRMNLDQRLGHAFAAIALIVSQLGVASAIAQDQGNAQQLAVELLPTGQRITPTAAAGARFQPLIPIPSSPDFTVGQAVELAVSPDGSKMLALTSGYNRTFGPDGHYVPDRSTEHVFVYDISGGVPVRRQAIRIATTFNGLAWQPDGAGFFVTNGMNDAVRVLKWDGTRFNLDGPPIALGHKSGNGIEIMPMAAGIAVSPRGDRLLVANFQNDSVSLVDLRARKVLAELDLRPGKIDAGMAGVPGGEYPFAVAWASDDKAYVGSQRDREILLLTVTPDRMSVKKRIKLAGQPTKMILDKERTRLFVAVDNSDTVVAMEAEDGDILAEIPTAAPAAVLANPGGLRGASPNNLALSPDGHTLFVTNGGLNAVAVIALGRDVLVDNDQGQSGKDDDDDGAKLPAKSTVIGLIPTGWYPNAVALGRDGRNLFVVNGKSNAGPNPGGCRDTLSTAVTATLPCASKNKYIWQLSKAGLLSMPVPDPRELARLTLQVAANNNFSSITRRPSAQLMAALRERIRHVVYIVKENRTYDQVLGDLELGNGDPQLTLLPEPLSPNHHALARGFVTLDNFFDSAESSNTGWVWSTAARTTDYTEKAGPLNYAERGMSYDQEGQNRNVNVGIATTDARRRANPATPADPDLLPGTADVAAPDPSAASGGEAGTGYLWDAALRAGLSVRNYGFYGDTSRYDTRRYDAQTGLIPPTRDPFSEKLQVFFPTKASLAPHTDIYFRGFDMAFPDFWRVREWQREFAEQVTARTMPSLTLLRLPHDHFGVFADGIDGVDTVETQMADNDYAIGQVVHTIATSPFASDTLIFIVEDDAQNGADHVDAHRSIALVAGPYVKRKALVSAPYTTVNLLRTIEDVLGLPPLGLHDGLAEPMSDVFDLTQSTWSYDAVVPDVLRATQLPLDAPAQRKSERDAPAGCFAASRHDAAWWDAAMAGQDFSAEDRLDTPKFNSALWAGLRGEDSVASDRPAADLRTGRSEMLAAWHKAQGCSEAVRTAR